MQLKHIFIIYVFMLPLLVGASVPSTFSGKIIDSKTGIIIEGASVLIEDTSIGTFSDSNGEFILYLGKGEFTVLISATGYVDFELILLIDESVKQEIKLEPDMKKPQSARLRIVHRRTTENYNVLADNPDFYSK